MTVDLVVLFSLYAVFFVPVAIRVAVRPTPRGEVGQLLRHPLQAPPGVLVQLVGGFLIVIGVVLAGLGGSVGPAESARAVAGSVALVAGSALNAWAVVHLRSWRFLPVLDEGHQLCTTGPYAWVRHPIYVAIDLVGVGSVLWAANPAVIAGAACFLIGGDLRARSEEAALIERFGDRYRDYARRVRRSVPGIY